MPGLDIDALRELRAEDPEALRGRLVERQRRPFLRGDRRLLIVAADHTARGVTRAGPASRDMTDRGELLARLAVALGRPGVDGVLGTADVLDDLAGLGLLEGRLAIGAVNRAGLDGAQFEVDDRHAAYAVSDAVAAGLDATKLLLRIDLDDPRTADAIDAAARCVRESTAARMPILLEPFLSARRGGRLVNRLDPESVTRAVVIAGALGGDSTRTWLKLPVVDDMERVLAATTLPSLLLGGDPEADADRLYDRWRHALALPGVRGLVAGRSMLYPADDDVTAHVDIAAELVHGTNRIEETT